MNNKQDNWLLIEGIYLAFSAPWLIFPTLFPPLTIAAGVGLGLFWLVQLVRAGRPLLPPSPLRRWYYFFALMVGVGVLISVDWSLSWPKATNLFLGGAVFRYAQYLGASAARQRLLLAVFLGLGAAFAVIGSLGAAWVSEIGFVAPLVRYLPAGLIQLPESAPAGVETNQLGSVPLLFIPLALAMGLAQLAAGRRQERLTGAGLLLYAVVMTLLVLISQSRSAWIGAAGGLISLLGLAAFALPPSPRRRRLRAAFIVLTTVALLALGLALPALIDLWRATPRDTVIGTLTTINVRQEVWRWALQAVADFPLTGVGLGAFRAVVHRYYPIATPIDYDIAHAHNLFLQIALDIGLPGLVAYLGLIITSARLAWRAAKGAGVNQIVAIGLLAGIISLHLYGMTDCPALGAKPWVTLWLALALIANLNINPDSISKQTGLVALHE